MTDDILALLDELGGADRTAVPGTADGVIQLPLGYGRKRSGRLGRHAGFERGGYADLHVRRGEYG